MILLSLSFLYGQLLPKKRQLDSIDHALLWTIKICLVLLFFTLPDVLGVADQQQQNDASSGGSADDDGEFFFFCSSGKLDLVAEALRDHPEWVNRRTKNGETCLHLTGIYGHAPVTRLLLEGGADPNARSTYSMGLRMHPLSWNVYGGHVENIELLLEYGADVNLDFDSMKRDSSDDGGDSAVTSFDVLKELLVNEAGDDRFERIEAVLRRYGAKTMAELREQSKNELKRRDEEL
jgi:ankyrin repeat protein